MIGLQVLLSAHEWLVRSDHRTLCTQILDRRRRPDGWSARLGPAPLVRQKHVTAVQQHGLLSCRYRHPQKVSDKVVEIDVTRRATGPDADIVQARICRRPAAFGVHAEVIGIAKSTARSARQSVVQVHCVLRIRVGHCVLRTTVVHCVLRRSLRASRTTVGYCVLRTTVVHCGLRTTVVHCVLRTRVVHCVLRTRVGSCVLRTTVGYCVLRTTVVYRVVLRTRVCF
jgi:hypothetical protein